MGTDKALLDLAGRPMLARVIEVLGAVSDDVFIVGDRAPYHGFGVPVVPDAFPGAGPLGAIATALHHARHHFTLVVACDMPFLSVELLHAMTRVPRDYEVLVPASAAASRSQGTGQGQTHEALHAIYARRCLPVIERRIRRGELKVVELYDDVRVRVLDRDWVRAIDPDERSFVNANDPAGLECARRIVASRAVGSGERA
jgi:molybdopterin-guanine dinucleotide biosynthesis protein A